MILSLNCGSSSVKYQLYDWDQQKAVINGMIERIGMGEANMKNKIDDKKDSKVVNCPNHKVAISLILDYLLKEAHIIKSVDEVEGVGHRVVHGGETFSKSVLIDGTVLEAIKACSDLAPLHNPPNIMGIESAMAVMPNVPHIAIFDTAFHQTMPEIAYTYAIDYELAKKHHVRRYGFHGSSHRYIAEKAAEYLGKEDAKIISIHVGNGVSLAAIDSGKSVDTSMGMTPLAGVVMGTRSGDIDPAIIPFIMSKTGQSVEDLLNVLNKNSGFLGIGDIGSSDNRDIVNAAAAGNKRCQLAIDLQVYTVKKYIGSYIAAMNGVDAIVFTAGIGENNPQFRAKVCANMGFLGIEIDAEQNNIKGEFVDLTAPGAKVKALVIPTDEEFVLARDVISLVRG